MKDEEERRTKEHRRVLAKIAYKDWKQTKVEEGTLKRKQDQIMRRQGMLNDSTGKRPPRMGGARPNTVKYNRPKVVRRPQSSYNRPDMASNNSSRYINTDHKRNQIQTSGNQAHLLSYSLNKNTKNMRVSSKDKKQRPRTAGKTRGYQPQQQMGYNQPPQMNQNTYNYGQQPGAYPGQADMDQGRYQPQYQQEYIPEPVNTDNSHLTSAYAQQKLLMAEQQQQQLNAKNDLQQQMELEAQQMEDQAAEEREMMQAHMNAMQEGIQEQEEEVQEDEDDMQGLDDMDQNQGIGEDDQQNFYDEQNMRENMYGDEEMEGDPEMDLQQMEMQQMQMQHAGLVEMGQAEEGEEEEDEEEQDMGEGEPQLIDEEQFMQLSESQQQAYILQMQQFQQMQQEHQIMGEGEDEEDLQLQMDGEEMGEEYGYEDDIQQ